MKKILLSLVLILGWLPFAVMAQDYPVAQNDTIDLYFPLEDSINITAQVLSNDYWPDSITVDFWRINILGNESDGSQYHVILNNPEEIEAEYYYKDGIYEAGFYLLKNTEESMINTSHLEEAQANIYYRIHNESHTFLDVNNVKAQINNIGNQFWDGENSMYEVPQGSGHTSIFNSTLWIGGMHNDELHFAGGLYNYGPMIQSTNANDFYPGPISDVYDEAYDEVYKNNIWKLDRSDIVYHQQHFQDAGYEPIDEIASWPGNGDTDLGQQDQLAPYFDNNANGVYEPMDGDYPIIRGDQCVYFIMNDVRGEHEETEGEPLGIEVQVMAYAYDRASDASINNSVFFHYDFRNNSGNDYEEAYVGIFSDLDIGWADDDYIQCNVNDGYYYAFNGDDFDGSGESCAYGENPPAQAVKFIAGPVIDADNEDNESYKGDCSIFDFTLPEGAASSGHAINGFNFGDNIVDNERFGMSGFSYFSREGETYQTDPDYANEYYSYMQGLWKDGSHVMYGANGHPDNGAYGPEARFMFPGESDPCMWGTKGVAPNGEVNWTEVTAANSPADKRGVGLAGPFTFEAGSVEVFDVAYVFAESLDGKTGVTDMLNDYVQEITAKAETNEIEILLPTTITSVEEQTSASVSTFNTYPNPANTTITLEGVETDGMNYRIIELTGRTIRSGEIFENTIDVSSLEAGVYLLNVYNQSGSTTQKIIINK